MIGGENLAKRVLRVADASLLEMQSSDFQESARGLICVTRIHGDSKGAQSFLELSTLNQQK